VDRKLKLFIPLSLGSLIKWKPSRIPELEVDDSKGLLAKRLQKAENWVRKYNPDQQLKLLVKPNVNFAENLSDVSCEQIRRLHNILKNSSLNRPALETAIYEIIR
jgi:lysyl-tRNA synthetase class I